ncbi:MAG: ATP-binding protein [Rikenellaceae bacterium]
MIKAIKPKERNTIIQSLKSGVVPRLGLQHIQVGRSEELKSLIKDVETIADGGTAFRFIIGEYGSGKTFFIQLVKSIALEKGLVTINADLSPNKRLNGRQGQARMLYSELISNSSTRTKQDGGALANILEKFISVAREESERSGKSTTAVIHEMLGELKDYVGGYDFATVVAKYWEGYDSSDDNLKDAVLRWLRGEYTTKTDALRDLGVRTYIDDATFYDSLKLFAILVRKAGYKGLLICLDEMVNLYKITNSVSRKANYEEILRMLNDSLQGSFEGIGFLMGGTPEFLTDGNRGLYSYEALRSRLSENSFAKQLGVVDYNSTALRLSNLTQEELYILLKNLRHVFASGKEENYLVPEEALTSYLHHCSNKIGESYFRTPRNTIKGFLDLLSTLEQYPDLNWSDMIEKIEVVADVEDTEVGEIVATQSAGSSAADDEFASFKL